ncbi:hypothetical protein BT63DRAFT_421579 [Microthyrium microscopicum]|uniref:Mannose 6-phosphate receptor domain-containing protein n=1 Tax=Microthyrium microscopicum TaxID=703497 RepID=A0A6A6UQR2_9PEZI|nr:hypothetical protein BT63DRAFT_421579 [Microthyrium microscopicum]
MAPLLLRLIIVAILSFCTTLVSATTADEWADESIPYKKGDLVPITCLNRTIDTGEHIADAAGNLQYIPFQTCKETSRPLTLSYLQSKPQNCTFLLTDPLFHLLEFYIHNDAPMTCRVPIRRPTLSAVKPVVGKVGEDNAYAKDSERFVPLVMALAGTLQRSHLHVATELNLLVHTGGVLKQGKKGLVGTKGAIEAAAAYSVRPLVKNTRIVIGDEVTLQFNVHWYEGPALANGSSASGVGALIKLWLLVGVVVGILFVYFIATKHPKNSFIGRMLPRNEDVLPKYNGYGYGIGPGVANGGTGKRD